jgi:hypothetical protein
LQQRIAGGKRVSWHGAAEEEKTDRVAERVVRQSSREDDRVLAIGCDAVLAEPLFDRLAGVADAAQRVAERGRGRAVGVGIPDRVDAASCMKRPPACSRPAGGR